MKHNKKRPTGAKPQPSSKSVSPRERAERLREARDWPGLLDALLVWRKTEPGPEMDGTLLQATLEVTAQAASSGRELEIVDRVQQIFDLLRQPAELLEPLIRILVRLRLFERAAALLGRVASIRPPSRQQRQDHALLLLAAGQRAEALDLVPDEGSSQVDGHVLRALAELRRGRPAVASGHLAEARRIGASGPSLNLLQAFADEHLGQPEAAERWLASPSVEALADARALVLLGNHRAAAGQPEAARDLWRRALEVVEPGPLAARLEPVRLVHQLDQASSDEAQLARYFELAPQADPDGSLGRQLRLRGAVASARGGEARKALPELEALAREEGSGPLAPLIAQNLALVHETLEQKASALKSWERMLAQHLRRGPAEPALLNLVHGRLARLRLDLEQARPAATDVQKALEHGPVERALVFAAAEALHDENLCQKAFDLIVKASERSPSDAELVVAAVNFASSHNWDGQVEHWQARLLELQPDHPEAKRLRIESLRDQLEEDYIDDEGQGMGDPAERRRLLDELVALNPKDLDGWMLAAELSLEQGNRERALKEWEEALFQSALARPDIYSDTYARFLESELDRELESVEKRLLERARQLKNFDALVIIGAVIAREDPQQGTPFFRQLLDPEHQTEESYVRVLSGLGDCEAWRVGDDIARDGLERLPDSPRILFLRSLCLKGLGKKAEAKKLAAQASRLARSRKDTAAIELIERATGQSRPRGLPPELGALNDILESLLGEEIDLSQPPAPKDAKRILEKLESLPFFGAGEFGDPDLEPPYEGPPHPGMFTRKKKKGKKR